MADNNQNWRNQSQQWNQDWEQNRNRYNQENDNRNNENYGSYGNAGYSNERRQNYSNEGHGSYSNDYENRVRYGNQQNDWDDNRYGQSNRDQGFSSTSAWNNSTGAFNRNQGNLGSSGQNYGSQDWRRGNDYASQYGSGYGAGTSGGYDRNYRQGSYQDRYGSGGQYGDRSYGNREHNFNSGRGDNERGWWERTRDEVSSWFGDDDAERRRRMDRMTSGQYKGKGPKDYKRSEDRIREDVCDRLTDDDRLDATNIQIQVQGDEVVLTGSVDSREQKRRAEDLVESISGVRNVENRLRVEHSYQGSTQSTLSNNSEKVRLSKDNR